MRSMKKLLLFPFIMFSLMFVYAQDVSVAIDLYKIGEEERENQDYESALIAYRDSNAVLLIDSIANKPKLAILYNAMGNVFVSISEFDSAFIYLDKSEANREPNSSGLAETFLNKGELYQKMGSYKEAISIYSKAIDIVEEDDNIIVSKLYNNIGTVYYLTDKYEEALIYYRKALAHNQIDKQVRRNVNNNMALILTEQKKYDGARSLYLENLRQYQLDEDISGIASAHFNYGHVNYREEKYEQSLSSFQKALLYSRLGNNSEIEINTLRILIDNFYMLRELDSALLYVDTLQLKKDEFSENINGGLIASNESQASTIFYMKNKSAIAERNIALLSLLIAGIFLISLSVYYHNRRKIAQQEKIITQTQHDLIDTRLKAIEEEQDRLSDTLHSSICALLTGAKLQFQLLGRKINNLEEGTRKRYDEAYSLLEQSYEETRKASHDLNDLILKQRGLEAQLQDFIKGFQSAVSTRIDLRMDGIKEDINKEIAKKIYRISQELITNALKYAKADTIQVALTQVDNELRIQIKDDGVGLTKSKNESSTGLARIQKSVFDLGGEMDIITERNKGTLIDIHSISLN